MRRNDFTNEFLSLTTLLELRPGDIALDAQTEADTLLPILYHEVTERGRPVGMCFGQDTLDKVQRQIEKMGIERVEVIAAHPIKMPFKNELFHGVVLRHDLGFPRIEDVHAEMWRISKSGARIIARHTEWTIKLPRATDEEQQLIDALRPPSSADGRDFFERFQNFRLNAWREVRMDVFTIATRDPRANARYGYDWRTLLRDQLTRTRKYTPREILSLIERLEHTRGAKVVVDRYLCLGIKT